MSFRHTIQTMQQWAADKGGKCLSKEYWGSEKKLVWRCAKGHTWDAFPFFIQRGSWCPACAISSKRYTMGEIQALAHEREFKCLSEEYINRKGKLKWKCSKGHIWLSALANIVNGSGCIYCSGKARGTIEKMQRLAKKKEGKCLSKIYINNHANLKWQCSKRHSWFATPSSIQTGTWCSRCNGTHKLNIGEMQKMALERDGKCLSTVYQNKEIKLKWQCGQGHIWHATPGNIRQGSWCKICARKQIGLNRRKYSFTDLQKIARSKNGECISNKDEFLNQYSRLMWRCKSGHVWTTIPKYIMNGSWCVKCYRINRSHEKLMKQKSVKK